MIEEKGLQPINSLWAKALYSVVLRNRWLKPTVIETSSLSYSLAVGFSHPKQKLRKQFPLAVGFRRNRS
jgi:hypothetical protein